MLHHIFSGNRNAGPNPNMTMGVHHLLGGSPISYNPDGNIHTWNMWGFEYNFKDDARMVPSGAKWNMGAMGAVDAGMSAFSLAGTLASVGMAYSQGGMGAAASSLYIEAHVNKALITHAYSQHAGKDGIIRYQPGRVGRPYDMARMMAKGKSVRGLGAVSFALCAGSLVDYGARMAGGSIAGAMVGSMVGNALGNGVMGSMAGMFVGAGAGGMAAKHTWKLAAAAGIGYGMTQVGRGTYNLLKSGYKYRQNQRQINTSGDMAAFATQGAYTMRARAVQAMNKSSLNARSALGQEASLMHRPSVNYNSMYR